MSWTPELVIGELRPWPDSVRVVRGNSGETMRYDGSERSNNGAERSSDGVDVTCVPDDYTAKLMAEVKRLQAENAKLRNEFRKMDEWHSKELVAAMDEIAKLRELVRVMAYCMQCERECDGCRLNDADGTITAPVGCDGLLDRMHELGIEEV